ncbi:lysozyme [Halyomorpha halys]|uniref:lysozyme n=1 Tax=Halyomorpha halys TaxID=286706 RepID=UPI0006D4FAE2|nr:lysozyme [Halyomorpha halys]
MFVKILVCALFFGVVASSTISRCRLAREMREYGIRRGLIPDWVCLAEAVSNLNTTALGGPYGGGIYTYGLFQIGSNIWCDIGRKGKKCNANCEDFLGDKVEESIRCAIEIYAEYEFYAWNGWISNCRGKPIPDVSNCF